jgi:hypothetical protein
MIEEARLIGSSEDNSQDNNNNDDDEQEEQEEFIIDPMLLNEESSSITEIPKQMRTTTKVSVYIHYTPHNPKAHKSDTSNNTRQVQ